MLRFAIPVEAGKLSSHFGHAPQVAFVDADPETRTVLKTELLQAPPHEHGSLPRFIKLHGAKVVLAGGIGGGASSLLQREGIALLSGAPVDTPENLVRAYLEGTLVTGNGDCGCHGHQHGHDHGHGQHRHGDGHGHGHGCHK